MMLNSWRAKIDWSGTIRQVFQRPPGEDPAIDGLRGMSSLAIVLFHSFYGVMFLLKSFDRVAAFLDQLPPWLGFVLNTDKAVDVFFMVSGYLMGGALFREMTREGRLDIRRFYVRRLYRIYPLFLLGIAFYAMGNPHQSMKNLIWNLLFIDNFKMKTIIPVGWSLSIEMQFYVVLPFLVYALWRVRERFRIIALGGLFAASFAAVAVTMLMVPVTYQTPFWQFHPEIVDPARFLDVIYYQTHTRFGPLVLGLIWAWLDMRAHRNSRNSEGGQSPVSPSWAIAGMALATIWAYFPVYDRNSWYYAHFSPAFNLFCHSAHRGLFCLGVLMTVRFAQGSRLSPPTGFVARYLSTGINYVLGARFWRPFSQVVFPVYLFHFPMVLIAGVATFRTLDPTSIVTVSMWQVALIFALSSTLALIAGIFLHVLVERPMILAGAERARRHQITRERFDRQSVSGS